jgi:hypothetical protein
MFRRNSYEIVGGYRPQFKVAQDLDLWIRLSEVGVCWGTPEVFCETYLNKNSISVARRTEQIRSTKVILECAKVRRSGRKDSVLIEKWAEERKWRKFFFQSPKSLTDARFYYFIGSLLRERQPEQAQLYFWRAVDSWIAFPRAWYRICRHFLRADRQSMSF